MPSCHHAIIHVATLLLYKVPRYLGNTTLGHILWTHVPTYMESTATHHRSLSADKTGLHLYCTLPHLRVHRFILILENRRQIRQTPST